MGKFLLMGTFLLMAPGAAPGPRPPGGWGGVDWGGEAAPGAGRGRLGGGQGGLAGEAAQLIQIVDPIHSNSKPK